MNIEDIPKVNNKSTKNEYAHAHYHALKCAKELQSALDERDKTIKRLDERLVSVEDDSIGGYKNRAVQFKQQKEKHTAEISEVKAESGYKVDRLQNHCRMLEDVIRKQAAYIAVQKIDEPLSGGAPLAVKWISGEKREGAGS